MSYTPEQLDAIHTHDHNLIVTAGAGSGKTRVLVDRFVALLEAHPDWSLLSLVAIMFTEKAAREMRDRVRKAIEDRISAASQVHDDAAIRRCGPMLLKPRSIRRLKCWTRLKPRFCGVMQLSRH